MRKKLLFIGASGTVARILIPRLAETYDVVGVSASRDELASHCLMHFRVDLLRSSERLFEELFAKHSFEAVIWNAVRYFRQPLSKATRITLHTEFDLAVALPLECAKSYLAAHMPKEKRFIAISSQSALGYRNDLASYSIVKRGQLMLMNYLADEHPEAQFYALLPGSVPKTDPTALTSALNAILTAPSQGNVAVRIEQSD